MTRIQAPGSPRHLHRMNAAGPAPLKERYLVMSMAMAFVCIELGIPFTHQTPTCCAARFAIFVPPIKAS
jgi:hypothetical protein